MGVVAALADALAPRAGHRPYASAGGLYAVETYLVAFAVDGLPRHTAMHLLVNERALEVMWTCEGLRERAFPQQTWGHEAPLVIVVVAALRPYIHDYGERGYRFALLEAGAVAHLIESAAADLGVQACQLGGFADEVVAEALGLDLECDEQPLVCLVVGRSRD